MFTHLHVHSSYSFLRGLASPGELAAAAATDGMTCLALTDHHTLTGSIEFYDACLEAGIRPILGLEVNLSLPPELPQGSPGVLVLLAMDLRGWRSLCRISSQLESDEAIQSLESLAQESAGLICLTGGRGGALYWLVASEEAFAAQRWLAQLQEIFHERIYVEYTLHERKDMEICASLERLRQRQDLPAVAAHDIHYLKDGQADLQRTLAAIRLIHTRSELLEGQTAPPDARFKAQSEMTTAFSAFPAALEAIQEITERCRLELPLGRPRFPEVPLPEGVSAMELLRQKAFAGAQTLYGSMTEKIRSRLEHELQVIGDCGYTPLFLIMEQVISFTRQQGIPFTSRGSAASSLVAHCLGITSPDPMRLNLYFERFLNAARATPPDIDTDLCSRRREEVIRYVYEQFGQEHVATVCTINRFRSRSALREVAKAYGLPSEQVSKLADSLPRRWYGPQPRRREESPYAELQEQYRTPLHREIFQQAIALIGLPHHLSVHPGGVVVNPEPMTDLVPTQMAAKGVTITQFDLEGIERLGLIKIDLLGIRGLTVIGDVTQAVAARTSIPGGKTFSGPDILESIPEQDPATSQTLQSGNTMGCFQIESPGMRATLREIRASSIDDLMVALALYRPGPLTGGLKTAFVRRHLGKEPVEHLHPALTSLLEETYGVILYQEQVLQIAHELAGLSLEDADLLRRAMSHFDPGKQMITLKEKFIAGARERSAVPEATAERIWELMTAFAGYGFPKAHAASYAQLAWRLAWCKTHHPALFITAVLANWGGYYPQRAYLTEARRMKLALYPPHINHARREFSLATLNDAPALFMGLDQVRDLTRRTQEAILQKRPFSSLLDFLRRVDPRPVEAANLVRAGALEGLGTIPSLLRQLSGKQPRSGQLQLFTLDTAADEEDWTLKEKVDAQMDILGSWVTAHPLELVQDQVAAANALSTVDAASRLGEKVRVAGMRLTWRRSLSQRGEPIYFMAFEDLEGMLDTVIFADVYRRYSAALKDAGPYVIEGEVLLDEEISEPFLRVEKVSRLT